MTAPRSFDALRLADLQLLGNSCDCSKLVFGVDPDVERLLAPSARKFAGFVSIADKGNALESIDDLGVNLRIVWFEDWFAIEQDVCAICG